MGLYTYSMYEYVYAYVRKYIRKVYFIYHIRENIILCKNITIFGSIGNIPFQHWGIQGTRFKLVQNRLLQGERPNEKHDMIPSVGVYLAEVTLVRILKY